MIQQGVTKAMTRRDVLRGSLVLTGSALIAPLWPTWVTRAGGAPRRQEASGSDPVAAVRAEMGATPIEQATLMGDVTLLSGPGGNIVVLDGPDGKIVVDSFLQPAWGALEEALESLGPSPLKILINTHWHFDHVDNNASFRRAGADIVAHANTRTRLSEPQQLEVLGMHFPAAPANALPTQTFEDTHTIDANGEQITVGYIQPAHTDTDVYIRYETRNLLHLGDLFFNGVYPLIDAGTGGSINGMIAGADMVLEMADANTTIVPGHGPVGDKAALTTYRDVLVTVRDRVEKLKTSGRTLEEVIAEKPTAELDEAWGQGFMQPSDFLGIVYNTL